MPIEIAPNRIELSDIGGGYAPDPSEAAVDLASSPDVLNLLPQPFVNELRLRHGFQRLLGAESALEYFIRHVWYYETIISHDRKRYLVCVLSNGENGTSNNVQIWVYNLNTHSFSRVDTVGRAWTRGDRPHWGAVIEGAFYGGTVRDKIYSWHPTDGWNATPCDPDSDDWVDSTSPSAGEKARNYAFKKGDIVKIGSGFYKAAVDIRFKAWESGQEYSKGERVSRKAAEGGDTYWRSFECIKSHTAGDTTDQPGTGATQSTYWKRVRLQDPLDEDGDLTDDWFYQPAAGKGEVGAYHANRLFVRHDDSDNFARVQYSAPAKPERDALIADLDFDPTDWAAVSDNEGSGGGWENIPFSGTGDGIRALHSFGNYLLVYGRWQCYVIAGLNPNTWTIRKLGEYGAVAHTSVCEMDGLVYSLGRNGVLTMTDGTNIQPVAGMEKIRNWLKTEVDRITGDDTYNWFPQLVAHEGRIWIALPDGTGETGGTSLVYDVRTQSFWPQNIPMLAMATGERQGTSLLFFSASINAVDDGGIGAVFKYQDDPGNEAFDDDDYLAAVPATPENNDISWNWRSAWFQFGMTHNERRIRKIWALVGGEAAQGVVTTFWKDFSTTYLTNVTRTLTGQATTQGEFVEGAVAPTTAAHAVAIRLGGDANERTSVHGIGVDTEPLRTRFHS